MASVGLTEVVGFTKSYSAGSFDDAAMMDMFATLKSYFLSAGFVLIVDQAEAFEVLPAGHAAGTISDDIPHWRIQRAGSAIYPRISASAIWGADYEAPNSRYSMEKNLLNADTDPQWAAYRSITFAADGSAGWWWLISKQWDELHPEYGHWFESTVIGSFTRRYAADRHAGLASRYGLYDGDEWVTPYFVNEADNISDHATGLLWSPLNGDQRPLSSPLPRMAAPVFVSLEGNPGAHLQGEIEHIMKLTSGYAWGEGVMPGWWAFAHDSEPLALPAPATFTAL